MSNYKMIVTDIDGTLVGSDHRVSPKNKAAIQDFIASGHIFVLASGRPTKGMETIVEELGLNGEDAYILAYNGAQLIHVKDYAIVFEHHLTNQQFQAVANAAKHLDLAFCSYTPTSLVVNRLSEEAAVEVEITKLLLEVKEDLVGYFKDKEIPKSIIFSPADEIIENERKVKELLGNDVEVFRSSDIFIEVMPKGVHKGAGIVELSKMFEIPIEEIIAVGDGGNDVSMIREAGLGIAVSNAIDELKSVADAVTVSNDEDALATIIADYF